MTLDLATVPTMINDHGNWGRQFEALVRRSGASGFGAQDEHPGRWHRRGKFAAAALLAASVLGALVGPATPAWLALGLAGGFLLLWSIG